MISKTGKYMISKTGKYMISKTNGEINGTTRKKMRFMYIILRVR